MTCTNTVMIRAVSLMSNAIQRAAINRDTHSLEKYSIRYVLLQLMSVRQKHEGRPMRPSVGVGSGEENI